MPATNDSGTIKYWKDGLPSEGGYIDANDGGTQKYWVEGLPSKQIIPTSGEVPTTAIKDIIGGGFVIFPR